MTLEWFVLTSKENPDCPECKSRAAFLNGKYGDFWGCEECDWTQSVNKPLRSRRSDQTERKSKRQGVKNKSSAAGTEKKLVCPKCGADMVKRHGRYGEFYGCSMYTKTNCKGTIKI